MNKPSYNKENEEIKSIELEGLILEDDTDYIQDEVEKLDAWQNRDLYNEGMEPLTFGDI